MFWVVLENSLSPAALTHGLGKECRALPTKNPAITRKRRGVDPDDSTLTLLMLPKTIKVASTCRKPSEGRSLRIGGAQPPPSHEGIGFTKTLRALRAQSRPASNNTSNTTTTNPSPPLG